jgi:hypothetical protein
MEKMRTIYCEKKINDEEKEAWKFSSNKFDVSIAISYLNISIF